MNFDAQEEFSYAYIHAIAAGAGCSCQVAPRPLDNSGIDMTLHANGKKGSYKQYLSQKKGVKREG